MVSGITDYTALHCTMHSTLYFRYYINYSVVYGSEIIIAIHMYIYYIVYNISKLRLVKGMIQFQTSIKYHCCYILFKKLIILN